MGQNDIYFSWVTASYKGETRDLWSSKLSINQFSQFPYIQLSGMSLPIFYDNALFNIWLQI